MAFLNTINIELFGHTDEERRKVKENLPRVIAVKRMKFLRAIGANDQLDESAVVNMDDENLPCSLSSLFSAFKIKPTSIPFDDSIVVNSFMKIKQPAFDVKKYISCVKRLYDEKYIVTSNLCYLLCHARDFTVPRNKLFTFSEQETVDTDVRSSDTVTSIQPQSPFTAKLMTLMDDLLVKYSEAKYQQINANVTYIVLLLTRKLFLGISSYEKALKNPRTHENFVDLCPQALSPRLPDDTPLLKNEVLRQDDTLVTLILYAYMHSTRRTRRVLETGCVAHMQHTGLALPMMFDKITRLYDAPAALLWDALCVDDCESMFALADLYDTQRNGREETPPKTYTLFPYCRVLSGHYHGDLACKYNERVCYAMALLIDKKIGLDKSHMREAHWTKELVPLKRRKAEALAAEVYEKINTQSDRT